MEERFPDDRTLLEGCRGGEPCAWEALCDRYEALIYSVPSVQFGLRPEDCADVLQETIVALLSQLDSIRKPDALRSWLVQTARRQCMLVIRKNRSEREKRAGLEAEWDGGHPEKQDEETLTRVRLAVELLGEDCRKILVGRYYMDPPKSYKQLSAETGLAVGSLGPTRARCIEMLLGHLKELERGGYVSKS